MAEKEKKRRFMAVFEVLPWTKGRAASSDELQNASEGGASSKGSVEHSSQMMKGFIHTEWQQIDSFPATVLWSSPLRTKEKTFWMPPSHMTQTIM